MMKRLAPVSMLCVIAVALSSSTAIGQWAAEGTPVCAATVNQQYPQITGDGCGGAIIVWQDSRGYNPWKIFAQRVDAKGRMMWIANGIAACDTIGEHTNPRLASDGAGGAIVVWEDTRSSGTSGIDLFAQRISADGAVLWKRNGQPISIAPGDQIKAAIVSDGAGGAIVSWWHHGLDYDIYGQRIDGEGFVHWVPNGRPICAASGDQKFHAMISDGMGGAILAWTDYRTSNYGDLYAQRVDAGGIGLWGANGTGICTASDSQTSPALLQWGDGGAIVAWSDYRANGWSDVYAQKVDGSGTVLWTADGVPVCDAEQHQYVPRLVSDGSGGAIVAWRDDRVGPSESDVYAQRIDGGGNRLWPATGVPVCTARAYQRGVQLAADGAGGAIMVWYDYRSSITTDIDVYAQRIDGGGGVQWAVDGVAICGLPAAQTEPQILSDGTASGIVTWHDNRSSYYDVYAQRIERDGQWGYPAPSITAIRDIPGDQGGFVEIAWEASRLDAAPGNAVTDYMIWRASSPTRGLAPMNDVSWELVDSLDATQALQYTDTIPTLLDSTAADPGSCAFRIVARAIAPEAYWESDPDTGRSADNVAPAAPEGLAGEQEYTPEGLAITWRRNTEPDVARYALYRGTDPEFAPAPDNLVASPEDTTWFDGEWRWNIGYCYKLSAIDVHGNESEFAVLEVGEVTGDAAVDVPTATYLAQNCPNPFNPLTKITFGLAEPGRVSLRIYDARGALVRTLVDRAHAETGRWTVRWDGTNEAGARVASGVYFARFLAGDRAFTRTMVLVR